MRQVKLRVAITNRLRWQLQPSRNYNLRLFKVICLVIFQSLLTNCNCAFSVHPYWNIWRPFGVNGKTYNAIGISYSYACNLKHILIFFPFSIFLLLKYRFTENNKRNSSPRLCASRSFFVDKLQFKSGSPAPSTRFDKQMFVYDSRASAYIEAAYIYT